jgi:hypothetical protein
MVRAKGTLTLGKGKPVNHASPVNAVPERDTSFVRKIVLLLAREGKLRYEAEGKTWVEDVGDFVPQKYISTFDGKTNKTFYGRGNVGAELHPLGFVNTHSANIDVDNYHLRPFLLLLRGLDKGFGGLSEDGWSLTKGNPFVEGRSVLVLTRQTRRAMKEEYWLDSEREFVVLRNILSVDGAERMRINCSYHRDPEHGWIPSSWEVILVDRRQAIVESARGQMDRYEINCSVTEPDFQFTFPVGTEVTDNVQDAIYIPQEGGSVTFITEQDQLAGRDYVTIIAGIGRSRTVWWIVLSGAALMFLSALVYGVVRRRRSKEGPQ